MEEQREKVSSDRRKAGLLLAGMVHGTPVLNHQSCHALDMVVARERLDKLICQLD